MPILRGAVTFSRYKVEFKDEAPSDVRRWFLKGLRSQAFEPLDKKSDEDRSQGFVELENNDSTDFPVGAVFHGERALFAWRIDTLKVSTGKLREELLRWEQRFEQEKGRKPARAEKNEQRDSLKHQMRNRAQPVTKLHDVAWNVDGGRLQIWSSSRKVIDEVLAAIEGGFEVKLTPLVPGALAEASGVAEDALKPTPELAAIELASVEGLHGQA